MYVIQLERHYLICEHANEALMGMCGVGKRSVPIVVGLTTDGDPAQKSMCVAYGISLYMRLLRSGATHCNVNHCPSILGQMGSRFGGRG